MGMNNSQVEAHVLGKRFVRARRQGCMPTAYVRRTVKLFPVRLEKSIGYAAVRRTGYEP